MTNEEFFACDNILDTLTDREVLQWRNPAGPTEFDHYVSILAYEIATTILGNVNALRWWNSKGKQTTIQRYALLHLARWRLRHLRADLEQKIKG